MKGTGTMGYYSTVSGEIKISPPLNHQEIKKIPTKSSTAWRDGSWDLKVIVVEEMVDTPEGELIKRYADTVKSAYEDSYKAYYVKQNLQELIDLFPGHEFTGALTAVGEDGDMWGVAVNDGVAVDVKPTITWPSDETSVPNRKSMVDAAIDAHFANVVSMLTSLGVNTLSAETRARRLIVEIIDSVLRAR